MIENKKKIFGLSPHNEGGDYFQESTSSPEIVEIDLLWNGKTTKQKAILYEDSNSIYHLKF